jgi:predicted metal-dependent phosphoesterase TrpH
MGVDLHLHTTASDGRLTPEEVVRLAAGKGLTVIAITDHDSVEGVLPALEAATAFPPLRVIPGVEINTDAPNGAVHILGYFMDYEDKEFQTSLRELRQSRELRAQQMIDKLDGLGVHVDWQRVQELAAGGSMGRPHIAQVMLENGHISSFEEAFAKYIGRRGPAYVKRVRLSPVEAVQMVVKAGGLPVLAHPADINDLEALLGELKKAGLVGLEAYYNGYRRSTVQRLVGLAKKHALLTTGGSDFHGLGGADETPIGRVEVPFDCAKGLIALTDEREVLTG